jgi:hypothetical protein
MDNVGQTQLPKCSSARVPCVLIEDDWTSAQQSRIVDTRIHCFAYSRISKALQDQPGISNAVMRIPPVLPQCTQQTHPKSRCQHGPQLETEVFTFSRMIDLYGVLLQLSTWRRLSSSMLRVLRFRASPSLFATTWFLQSQITLELV